MYHIKIAAPVTCQTRRYIKGLSGVTIDRDSRDKSARFVTIPGWYQPEAARAIEQIVYEKQACEKQA